jgi:hypothetical protein
VPPGLVWRHPIILLINIYSRGTTKARPHYWMRRPSAQHHQCLFSPRYASWSPDRVTHRLTYVSSEHGHDHGHSHGHSHSEESRATETGTVENTEDGTQQVRQGPELTTKILTQLSYRCLPCTKTIATTTYNHPRRGTISVCWAS